MFIIIRNQQKESHRSGEEQRIVTSLLLIFDKNKHRESKLDACKLPFSKFITTITKKREVAGIATSTMSFNFLGIDF